MLNRPFENGVEEQPQILADLLTHCLMTECAQGD